MIPILLFTALIVLILIVGWSIANGISPTPSSRKQSEEILHAIPRDFSGTIYDPGSGWGTLVIYLARNLPKCKVVGIENSWIPYLVSKLILLFVRGNQIEIRYGNFLQHPMNEADLVVCYLFRDGMRKLKSKLETELKPGTIVISNTFAIDGWQQSQVFRATDMYRSPIYVYQVPCVIP